MAFTEEQQRAIDAEGKNLLVAAAAGSGKTKVLVERILQHLLQGWNINELLVVTFTRAAAAEMSERIGQRLQEAAAEQRQLLATADTEARKKLQENIRHLEKQQILLPSAEISTIHSFCQEVIKRNPDRLPIDMCFRVADAQEVMLLAQEVLEDYLEEGYEQGNEALLRLSEKYSTGDKGDEVLCGFIGSLYTAAYNQPQPDRWLRSLADCFELPEGTALRNTPWWEPLLRRIRLELAELPKQLQAMQDIRDKVLWDLPDDKKKQKNTDDLQKFVELYTANCEALLQAEKNGWDALREAAQPAGWGRKPGFIKAQDADSSTQLDGIIKGIKSLFSHLQSFLLASEAELLADVRLQRETVADLVELTMGFAKRLAEKKREKNIIDFNDMEHFSLAVLAEENAAGEFVPTAAALELRDRYKEVMVDEYQDSNKVQDTIFRLITGDLGRLFTVGDVKQSIYGFRAAEPSLFLERYRTYQQPSATPQELVCLTKNFRSRKEILEAVNFIFAQVMQEETLEIEYDANARLNNGLDYKAPKEGETVDKVVELLLVEKSTQAAAATDDTEEDAESLQGFAAEARMIARRLKELKQKRVMVFDKDQSESVNNGYHEIRWRDMVVLLRSKQVKADVMLEALTAEDIPAYAEGGGGFFQATEVKLMLALLAVIDNLRQDIPLAAVLVSPVVGLQAAELAQIRLGLKELRAKEAEEQTERNVLYGDDFASAVIAGAKVEGLLPAVLQVKLAGFLVQLRTWRRLAGEVSVPELIWQLYRDTGYYDYVGGLAGGLLRQANLRMLVSRAEQYEKTDFRGLFRFLRFVEKLHDTETDLSVARTLGEGEDVVRVMTIHKSKGLEFPVVVLADMGKGFNKQDLWNDMMLHKELGLGLKQVDTERRIKYPSLPFLALKEKKEMELRAEELRVLYVALTRAREKLILTGCINPLVTPRGEDSTQKQRWSAGATAQGRTLPVQLLAQANSYLDWVVPAVARHGMAGELRELLGTEYSGECLEAEGDSYWQIKCISEDTIKGTAEQQAQNEILQAVHKDELLPGGKPEEQQLVAQVLSWQYDFRGTTDVPSKLSVSELKRRFAAEAMAEEQGTELLVQLELAEPEAGDTTKNSAAAAAQLFRRPSFLQTQKKLTAAEYGTLLHNVLQHLDLAGGLTAHGVKAQLDAMVARGVLHAAEAEAVKLEHITAFFQSALGKRLLAAKEVWRELPFCRLLPAQRFYDKVTDEKATIFSQGIIDLLFREADGGLVLVDYKTDRDTTPDKVRARYKMQLELYGEAVESITGEAIKERYLYLLRDGSIVEC